jgi:hypothetical protein
MGLVGGWCAFGRPPTYFFRVNTTRRVKRICEKSKGELIKEDSTRISRFMEKILGMPFWLDRLL